MKIPSLLFAVCAVFLLYACSKPGLSQDSFYGEFKIVGSSGNCTGYENFATLVEGVKPDKTDTIHLTVNVKRTGNWTYSMEQVNGVTFSGGGNFTSVGPQIITLRAYGKPQKDGIFNFKLKDVDCSFSVEVLPAAGNDGTARFKFASAQNGCTGAIVAGRYQPLTVLNMQYNFVELKVDVSIPGTYKMVTNLRNGMVFTAKGEFTSTGPNQTIIFRGQGICLEDRDTYFDIGFPPDICAFKIPVSDIGFPATGDIKATVDGIDMAFNYQVVVFSQSRNDTSKFRFACRSSGSASNDSRFSVTLDKTDGPIGPGLYNPLANPSSANTASATYKISNNYYQSSSALHVLPEGLKVNLTTYNNVDVVGTLSGKLYLNGSPGGAFVTITNGTFNIKL